MMGLPRPVFRTAAAAAAALALSACAAGPIADTTPASNGQSFVSGRASLTVFHPGQGPVAPEVSGRTLTGTMLRLGQYRGDVVVMNFWGSWCTPCRAEAPALAALAQRFHAAGVRFVGVDIRDSVAAALAFQRDFRISYPSFNDPGGSIVLRFSASVSPAGIPTTLVIARDGRVSARVIGSVSYNGLRQLIRTALASPA